MHPLKKLWAAARDIVTYPVRDAIDDYRTSRQTQTPLQASVSTVKSQAKKYSVTLLGMTATAVVAGGTALVASFGRFEPAPLIVAAFVTAADFVMANVSRTSRSGRTIPRAPTPAFPSLR